MTAQERIEWCDDLLTGVAEIDEQHQILVNSINEANTRLSTGQVNAEILEKITKDLLSYALYHFETEEELMQAYDYAQAHPEHLQAHQQQHREFSSTVVTVRDGIKSGQLISREELLGFLNHWLIHHIRNTDKHLGAFIQSKRRHDAT
jgi:hemerythrin-like metal-binding protein